MLPGPILLLLLCQTSAFTIEAAPPQVIPETARSLLGPKAFIVADGKKVVFRMWKLDIWRSNAEPEQLVNGLTLKELEPGQTLGWIELPFPLTDFRGRQVNEGIFSVRFGVQPASDDHNDSSPAPYFAVLTPPGNERWNQSLSMEDLLTEGKKILPRHPAIFLLYPLTKEPGIKKGGMPLWLMPSQGIGALAWPQMVEANGQKGILGAALVIKGISPAVKNP